MSIGPDGKEGTGLTQIDSDLFSDDSIAFAITELKKNAAFRFLSINSNFHKFCCMARNVHHEPDSDDELLQKLA
jgi:hypothetical protein